MRTATATRAREEKSRWPSIELTSDKPLGQQTSDPTERGTTAGLALAIAVGSKFAVGPVASAIGSWACEPNALASGVGWLALLGQESLFLLF